MTSKSAAKAGTATASQNQGNRPRREIGDLRDGLGYVFPQDLASVVHKGRSRLQIERAFLTFKIMLFKLVAQGLREFAKHILFCGPEPYGLTVVHPSHPNIYSVR